jgi:hypothetical protein
MKGMLTALLVLPLALLIPAEDAQACSRCAMDAPRCDPTNYRNCAAYPRALTCDDWQAACGFTYDAGKISADGSLAALPPEVPADVGAEVRGCHGLIVHRAFSADQVASFRDDSRRLVI